MIERLDWLNVHSIRVGNIWVSDGGSDTFLKKLKSDFIEGDGVDIDGYSTFTLYPGDITFNIIEISKDRELVRLETEVVIKSLVTEDKTFENIPCYIYLYSRGRGQAFVCISLEPYENDEDRVRKEIMKDDQGYYYESLAGSLTKAAK